MPYTEYGLIPADFRAGDRVQLHPATDLWMRGARYATVVRIGRGFVYVLLDGRSSPYAMRPHNLRLVPAAVPA